MPAKNKKSEVAPSRAYTDWLFTRLKDPQKAADYINAALEDGSPGMLLLAVRDVAEAHKMAKVAEGSGVAREAIYRILSSKGNPRLSSLWGVFSTLGLELTVRPRATKANRTVAKGTRTVHKISAGKREVR